MNKYIEIDVGGVDYRVDVLTDISTRVFVSNYIVVYNKETNKLRVFDAYHVDGTGEDLTKGLLFNTEDNDS